MIWLSWRQFRVQAAVALVALLGAAVLLLVTGLHLRHLYNAAGLATMCKPGNPACATAEASFMHHDVLLRSLLGPLLIVIPALLGVFWGAPLVARELESATFRLAWTQSVSRGRWLTVKLALVGLASVAVAALFSWLVSWWFAPIDHLEMQRFTPATFDERGIVAVGYVAFAFTFGVAAGAIIRRTLPAMASTLVAFIAIRLIVGLWVRPQLIAPLHKSVPLGAASNLGFVLQPGGSVTFAAEPPTIPNAWVYSSRLENAAGRTPSTQTLHQLIVQRCPQIAEPPIPGGGGRQPAPSSFHECIVQMSARFHELVAYQPADRYWTFQALETAIFLALALLLTALSFRWVRRGLA